MMIIIKRTLELFKDGHLHLEHLFRLFGRLHLEGDLFLRDQVNPLVNLSKATSPNLLCLQNHYYSQTPCIHCVCVKNRRVFGRTTFHLSLTMWPGWRRSSEAIVMWWKRLSRTKVAGCWPFDESSSFSSAPWLLEVWLLLLTSRLSGTAATSTTTTPPPLLMIRPPLLTLLLWLLLLLWVWLLLLEQGSSCDLTPASKSRLENNAIKTVQLILVSTFFDEK